MYFYIYNDILRLPVGKLIRQYRNDKRPPVPLEERRGGCAGEGRVYLHRLRPLQK